MATDVFNKLEILKNGFITGDSQSIITCSILIILIVAFANGYHKGAARTLAPIISVIAGLVLTKPLSNTLISMFGNVFYKPVYNWINRYGESLASASNNVLEDIAISTGTKAALLQAESLSQSAYYLVSFFIISVAVTAILNVTAILEALPIIGLIGRGAGGVIQVGFSVVKIMFFFTIIAFGVKVGFDGLSKFYNLLSENIIMKAINSFNFIYKIFL